MSVQSAFLLALNCLFIICCSGASSTEPDDDNQPDVLTVLDGFVVETSDVVVDADPVADADAVNWSLDIPANRFCSDFLPLDGKPCHEVLPKNCGATVEIDGTLLVIPDDSLGACRICVEHPGGGADCPAPEYTTVEAGSVKFWFDSHGPDCIYVCTFT